MAQPINRPRFTVGALIEIDSLQRAYIRQINNNDDGLVFQVEYCVGNTIESNIPAARCCVVNHDFTPTTRSGRSRITPVPTTTNKTTPTKQHQTTDNTKFRQYKESLKNSSTWNPTKPSPHPLMQFMKSHNTKHNKGWLKELINDSIDNGDKELKSERVKHYLLISSTLLAGLSDGNGGQFHGWTSKLAHAFGYNRSHIRTFISDSIDKGSFKRKERSDKGSSVSNCAKKPNRCTLLKDERASAM